MADHTITRTSAGWYYRVWLTRERMFCKMCKQERGVWVQLGGSKVMADADVRNWRFFGPAYWAKVRQAVKRHFADEHPQITIR